jgi:hypothetical protein
MLFILSLAVVMLALAARARFRRRAASRDRRAQHHRAAGRGRRRDADQLHRAQRSGQAHPGVAMIIGRIETLALIALLNPAFWRG